VVQDYFCRVVEVDAGWTIREEIAETVFCGVVDPFFYVDLCVLEGFYGLLCGRLRGFFVHGD
jgi:hypothetical protein